MIKANGDDRLATPDEIGTAISLGLLKLVSKDVKKEKDEAEALRKVLLLLLAVMGGKGNEGDRLVQDWIITEFKPIARRFRKNLWQDWIGEHGVARAREHDSEHVVLVIPKSLVDEILGLSDND